MGYVKNKPIPISLINKAMKSICKIRDQNMIGTGFFIKVNSIKYLITCRHVVRKALENKSTLVLEIYNNDSGFKISIHDRFTKCLDMKKNIAAIEIKDSDDICKYIEYLDYDNNYNNYIKVGYSIYEYSDVFSLSFVCGEDLTCASGKIEKNSDFEFVHSVSTEMGSSGSPIILISKKMKVIGIHTGFDIGKRFNFGTYLGEIIEILKKIDIPKQVVLKEQNLDKNKIYPDTNNKNLNSNNKINNKIYSENNKNKINNENNIINNNIDIKNNNNINHDESSNQNEPLKLAIDISQKGKKDIINFVIKSMDQLLDCKAACMSNDRFNKIVNAILEKEPSLLEKVGYFLCNGDKVNEYKTLKDNKIKNGSVVLLCAPD